MSEVRSLDGTRIAYTRTGSGPALIQIDGALCSRAFGPSTKLAARSSFSAMMISSFSRIGSRK